MGGSVSAIPLYPGMSTKHTWIPTCDHHHHHHHSAPTRPAPWDDDPWASPLPSPHGIASAQRARGFAAAPRHGSFPSSQHHYPPPTTAATTAAAAAADASSPWLRCRLCGCAGHRNGACGCGCGYVGGGAGGDDADGIRVRGTFGDEDVDIRVGGREKGRCECCDCRKGGGECGGRRRSRDRGRKGEDGRGGGGGNGGGGSGGGGRRRQGGGKKSGSDSDESEVERKGRRKRERARYGGNRPLDERVDWLEEDYDRLNSGYHDLNARFPRAPRGAREDEGEARWKARFGARGGMGEDMLGAGFDHMGDEMGGGMGGPNFSRGPRGRRRRDGFGGGMGQGRFRPGGGPAAFGRADLNGGLGLDDGFGDEDDDLGLGEGGGFGMSGGLGMASGGRHAFDDIGQGMDPWSAQGLGKGLSGPGLGKRRMRRDRPSARRRRGAEMDPLGGGAFMSGGNGLGGLGGFAEGEENNSWEDVENEPEMLQNQRPHHPQPTRRKARSRQNSQQPNSSQPQPSQPNAASHLHAPNSGQWQPAPQQSQPPFPGGFSGQPPTQHTQMPQTFTYPPPPQGPPPGITVQQPTAEGYADEEARREAYKRATGQELGL